MARGHQKLQSQAKAQEKAAKIKKQQGHSANDQKKAAQAGLKASCTICKVTMTFLDISKHFCSGCSMVFPDDTSQIVLNEAS